MKELIRSLLRRCDFEIVCYRRLTEGKPPRLRDLSDTDVRILDKIAPCTMTSVERQAELLGAVHHQVRHNIWGGIVECGVWRAGGCMAAALALLAAGGPGSEVEWLETVRIGCWTDIIIVKKFRAAMTRWDQC